MADTALNNGTPLRIEAAGILRLNDGSTDYDIRELEPGSLEIDVGGYEVLHWQDRGVNQTPLEGNEKLSKIRAKVKVTKFASVSLYNFCVGRDATTGNMKQFTITAEWKDYKGAATGKRLAFAGCNLAEPPKIRTGVQFDIMELEFDSTTAIPTASTF